MNRLATGCAHDLVGQSPQIGALRRLITKVSRNRLSVLLLGESGTGKEVVARAVHNANPRGEFVPIDCGSLVGTLMESEMFGHVKGSFSGAVENKKGLVELADGGTAFFDEIGDLPLEMQVKLLRLIQEGEFRAVGALHWRKVDLRIMAATHRDLRAEVAAGRFREDLYYRLNVVQLLLPPLRDRGDDIVVLARYMLSRYAPEYSSKVRGFTSGAIVAIQRYRWPGNIRELENRIKKAVVLADKAMLGPEDLGINPDEIPTILPLAEARDQWQRSYINEVLGLNAGNRTKTARDLGVDPRTIFRHLEKEEGGDSSSGPPSLDEP